MTRSSRAVLMSAWSCGTRLCGRTCRQAAPTDPTGTWSWADGRTLFLWRQTAVTLSRGRLAPGIWFANLPPVICIGGVNTKVAEKRKHKCILRFIIPYKIQEVVPHIKKAKFPLNICLEVLGFLSSRILVNILCFLNNNFYLKIVVCIGIQFG